jgi:ribulose-phosphate 3-epimerase
MNGIEIIPTYVPRDLEDLRHGVEIVRSFASAIHIDIDDGKFTPTTTWPYTQPGIFGDIGLGAAVGIDAEMHLMVEESREIGIAFARAGASRILGHVEGFADGKEIFHALQAWRDAGAREVGLGLLLTTPLEVIEPYLIQCNVVHLMSIATIGTQGIPYDASAPARIAEFHARFPQTLISVDGGVSEKNIADLARAGARRFGVGSAIMKAENPTQTYRRLQTLAQSALRTS